MRTTHRAQLGLHQLNRKASHMQVPRVGGDDAARANDARHLGNAPGGSGTKPMTNAITAASNLSSGKGSAIASPCRNCATRAA
jgi:hypothetical protein